MKCRFLLAWLVVGVISRLAAQDVTVSDPAWLDPENPAADQLPAFKKRPKPEYPDELKKSEQVAYAILWETLDEKGKRLNCHPAYSNPYLAPVTHPAVAMDAIKYSPAKRDGKAVISSYWFGIIFNPRSASIGRDDATPRLLAVAPILVDKKDLPAVGNASLVIWATLNLDEKGQLQNYVFEDPAYERLRPQVGGSLHLWRFAPARRAGQPVAAGLKVPLVVTQPYVLVNTPGVPPKILSRQRPVYPRAMINSGMRGEVLLEFVVDKTGAIKNPVVLQSNNPCFNEAAIEALSKWKFEPGRMGGEPLNTRLQLPMIFEMLDETGRDFSTVETSSKQKQEKLPEQLRYDIAPTPKGVAVPVYPYPLVFEKVNGGATVAFLIDEDGRVARVKVLEASRPEFGLALAAAAETYTFTPAMKAGRPTKTLLRTKHEFAQSGVDSTISSKERSMIALEKNHPEKILSAKKLDTPIKPVSRRAPIFPSAMRECFDNGEAKIEVLIDTDGKVRLPRIVEATDPAFGYAAIQAVADWRFEPPVAGGKAVVVRVQVPFSFRQETPGLKPAPKTPPIDQATLDSAAPAEKQP